MNIKSCLPDLGMISEFYFIIILVPPQRENLGNWLASLAKSRFFTHTHKQTKYVNHYCKTTQSLSIRDIYAKP